MKETYDKLAKSRQDVRDQLAEAEVVKTNCFRLLDKMAECRLESDRIMSADWVYDPEKQRAVERELGAGATAAGDVVKTPRQIEADRIMSPGWVPGSKGAEEVEVEVKAEVKGPKAKKKAKGKGRK